MEVCRITVGFDPLYISENRVGGAPMRMRLLRKKEVMDACGWAWLAAGAPKTDKQVICHLIVRRLARMDQSNIWGAMKWPIDALFKGQITPNDSERWFICGHIKQEVGEQYRHKPEVVFIVETVEP